MKDVEVHRSNLISALSVAIEVQSKIERETLKYDRDSALVAGWHEVREALQHGGNIKLK
jgi:hypothetical protein